MGGPGETQIEIDRRLIGERITKIKKELETVTRTRSLHRKARARVPYPVVALVGYTNAGKSTLFNALTRAGVVARDQLFATLDPTMRTLRLPSGRQVILSDTVGFVSDLPHELVSAFRATLEEVTAAGIILHVRDISHEETELQRQDVESVLGQLGIDPECDTDHVLLEALNKIDLLDIEARTCISGTAARQPRSVPVSAETREGLDDLLAAIDRVLSRARQSLVVEVPSQDGETLAWLYRHGEVLKREDAESAVRLTVLLDAVDRARLEKRGSIKVMTS